MRNVLYLLFMTAAYAMASGLLLGAAPQASLQFGASSQDLGIMGACSPIGYAGSCLLFGWIFQNYAGKWIVAIGIVLGIFAAAQLFLAESVAAVGLWMFVFGISSGAFWPFTSAWMFDFTTPNLTKTKILRLYNVGWTSGTAIGVFAGGYITRAYDPQLTFKVGAFALLASFILSMIPPPTHHSLAPSNATATFSRRRVGVALLIAAVIANLSALAMRSTVVVNYAELNSFLGHQADRMGIFVACTMAGQMLAFIFGSLYEPLLGLRRVYAATAVSIVLVSMAFAFSDNLIVLIAASLLIGLLSAVAFQCNIIAATECFATQRLGTTFHEAMVGLGGLAPIPAGFLADALKPHTAEGTALQSPFFALAGLALLGLFLQMWLISRRANERVLLPAAAVPQH
ncbi:MAG TPA: MFS transporter [Planctomycetota bacterium]|nr:MFS transporter [Planctomycetota bacterium]